MGAPYVEVRTALLLQSVLGKKRLFSQRDTDKQLEQAEALMSELTGP